MPDLLLCLLDHVQGEATMLGFIHEFDLHAEVTPDDVGVGPFGHRRIANITSGYVSGDRLNGTITGAGADWMLRGTDGFGRIDARLTVRTDDSAMIYVQYFGILELTPGIVAVMRGGETPTDYEDQYFITCPRLETGAERYAWVNKTAFIAEGRVSSRGCRVCFAGPTWAGQLRGRARTASARLKVAPRGSHVAIGSGGSSRSGG